MNLSNTVCLINCKLSLMLVEDTQSIKNVCICIINIIIYIFPSFYEGQSKSNEPC